MMKRFLQAILGVLLLTSVSVFGQDVEKKRKVLPTPYKQGRFMGGAGVTFLGLTAKAGVFARNRFWVGAEGEVHNLMSDRIEGGLFARYYPWNGRLTTFSELGVSYGKFGLWDWDFDNEIPGEPWRGKSYKLNLGLGIEYRVSDRVGLEILAKAGKLTAVNWIQPSFQGSININLGRK